MQEYRDSGREIKVEKSIQLTKQSMDNLDIYTYTINNPKLLHTYCIQWKFK